MTAQTPIPRPRHINVRKQSETPKGAAFIGPKSKWWPKNAPSGNRAHDREMYRQAMMAGRNQAARFEIRRTLRGKDIASSCPENQPSFVEVLLEIANGEE